MNQKPIFIRMFGDTPKVRVLNYLIRVRGMDFSMSDIARNSNVGWATLNRMWNEFIQLNIVIKTRNVGKAKLYVLNESNPAVKELIGVYKTLFVLETKRYFKKRLA